MLRPSALAVLRLMTNSNLADCMHRQVGRFVTLENTADVDADLAICSEGWPVSHQAAAAAKSRYR